MGGVVEKEFARMQELLQELQKGYFKQDSDFKELSIGYEWRLPYSIEVWEYLCKDRFWYIWR